MFQPYSSLPAAICVEALRVGDELRRVQRVRDVVDEASRPRSPSAGPARPGSVAGGGALVACAGQGAGEDGLGDAGDRDAEVERGLARSSGRCPSARPGPGRRRRTARRSSASTWPSTSAVISIRNDSRSPLFQLRKMSAISAGAARHVRGAGRRPRRSAACRRTRCRCGPSSRSGRRRPGRRGCSRARRHVRGDLGQHRLERRRRTRRAARHDARAVAARPPRRRTRRCRRSAGPAPRSASLAAPGVGEVRVAGVDDRCRPGRAAAPARR